MTISRGRNHDPDFRRDMSRYINRASKSQERFLALDDLPKKTVPSEKKEEILVKEKTPFGHFLSNLKSLFSTDKKEEVEEGEDVTDKVKETEDVIVETYSDEKHVEHVEEEKPKKKGSWFSRLFSVESEVETIEQEEVKVDDSAEDIKKLAIFSKEILENLPPDELMRLRREGKIDEYKAILKKHSLIK